MAHYSYFAWAVNESKSVLEAENQPLFLCPVCLRKLQKAVGWVHWLMYPSGLCHEGYTFKGDYWHAEDVSLQNTEEYKILIAINWLKSVHKFIKDNNNKNPTRD